MSSEITQAIAQLTPGDSASAQRLLQASYGELKRLAHSRLWASNLGGQVATESLVHESYMRLGKLHQVEIPDRRHYFAYASKVMRSVILDSLREAQAERRGGGHAPVTLISEWVEHSPGCDDVAAVHEALADLERVSPELAELVEMRFFGGLTEPEIAQAMGVSERTVRRQWVQARAALLVLLEK